MPPADPSPIDRRLEAALRGLPPKPPDTASASAKKRYSELLSAAVALAVAEELRERGLREARPGAPGEGGSGAERRMAGGIGAKKVDVTWATEEAGLMLAISIKSINFRDASTGNYQKNLTNRRGDMLMEAVTLHRRFPYAVLGAFFFLDGGAARDNLVEDLLGPRETGRRSTFRNAHSRLRLFTGRDDPAGRDEQFERFYIILVEAAPEAASWEAYEVGRPETPVPMAAALDALLEIAAERNPDFYEYDQGALRRV